MSTGGDGNVEASVHTSEPQDTSAMSTLRRVAFTVHGTVQGVFFRKYTASRAAAHKITGYVKNAPNGKVEGEAQGERENMKAFLKDVDKGSPGSKVVRLDVKDIDVVDGEKEFEIRR